MKDSININLLVAIELIWQRDWKGMKKTSMRESGSNYLDPDKVESYHLRCVRRIKNELECDYSC